MNFYIVLFTVTLFYFYRKTKLWLTPELQPLTYTHFSRALIQQTQWIRVFFQKELKWFESQKKDSNTITRFQKNISRNSSSRPSLNRVCANRGLFFSFQFAHTYVQREQESRFCSRFRLNLGIISYPWLPWSYLNSLDQGNFGIDWKRWLHKGKLLYIYFWFDYTQWKHIRLKESSIKTNFQF